MVKSKKQHVKFRNLYAHRKINIKWIISITIITFWLALVLGYISIVMMDLVNLGGAVAILFLLILIGVFFDLLGISVTAAEETPFHSMAASKVHGAKESISLIRNAGAVANFFNDVIGDISGIISGAASAAILIKMNLQVSVHSVIYSIILTAFIAAVTVGLKAIGKEIALRNSNRIVYQIGLLINHFKILRRNSK